MKKQNAFWGIMFLVASLAFARGVAFADDNEVGDLKNQVRDLNDKLSSLEKYVKTMEQHISSTPSKESMAMPTPVGEHPGGLIHTMQDINMSGFLDVQYNNNLSNEGTNLGGTPLRVFDNNQDTFQVDLAEIDFEKLANPEGGVGFRVDIAMGEDAQVIDTASPNTDADEFAIQQAYVELAAPLKYFDGSDIFGNSVDIKVGRFVTLAGAEVIESKDDWNISRSFMFGFGEPASHVGARAKYMLFKDRLTTYVGAVNGWDNVIDNNSYKTLETGVSFSPLKNVTVTSSLYAGPENATQAGHKRYLLSNVVAWNATDKLSLIGAIDFGNERRVVGLGGLGDKDAQWHGYAAYAKYQLTPKWAGAYRFEIFRDDDLFRTLATNPDTGEQTLWSQTFTVERKIYDALTGRLEFRFDKSNDFHMFNGDSSQSTLDAQLLYSFA